VRARGFGPAARSNAALVTGADIPVFAPEITGKGFRIAITGLLHFLAVDSVDALVARLAKHFQVAQLALIPGTPVIDVVDMKIDHGTTAITGVPSKLQLGLPEAAPVVGFQVSLVSSHRSGASLGMGCIKVPNCP